MWKLPPPSQHNKGIKKGGGKTWTPHRMDKVPQRDSTCESKYKRNQMNMTVDGWLTCGDERGQWLLLTEIGASSRGFC
eukprot:m.207712 g.207712  ORF g.207712 m.207712 type:complete len:78 (+) comp16919_c0_seq8:8857-9090(+)